MHKFGMLFQGGALFDSLPVWENISFALLQNHKLDRAKARELAIEKLQSVGLSPDVANLSPSELSGGMQKRVALARAIAANPEIIFFDEPTTGLDPIMADVINQLIVKCSKDLGATTLTITHDMASVRRIAHRVAMLYQGKLIWQGEVREIERSSNEYVDQFIHGRAEGPIAVGVK
jgi:phospholipid/cholesterol/gamma-HCH transport system ATP-binding protein